jgi:hypothetical protein
MKHALIAGVFAVCALGISIPSDARADDNTSSVRSTTAVETINARLEALTKMIDDLKKRLDEIKRGAGSNATTTPATRPNRPNACAYLDKMSDARWGSRGDNVLWVQKFLIEEGDLSADSSTGYFGNATERGLQKWQSRNGVTWRAADRSWFDSRTREAMRKRCAESVTPNAVRISPQTGTVPLKVEISTVSRSVNNKMNGCVYSVGRMGASGNGLTVDWGDGTVSPTANASSTGRSCKDEVKKHTYTKPGTYTVTVRSWNPGPNDAPVTAWQGKGVVTVKATSTAVRPTTTRPISRNIRSAMEAREALADTLNVSERRITVTKVEAKEWSDGCLGLGGAAEICAAVITPGYRVTMKHATSTYYARTDKTGDVVRIEP